MDEFTSGWRVNPNRKPLGLKCQCGKFFLYPPWVNPLGEARIGLTCPDCDTKYILSHGVVMLISELEKACENP
jgi:hypothetical protein